MEPSEGQTRFSGAVLSFEHQRFPSCHVGTVGVMSRRVMTFRLPGDLVDAVDGVRGDVTRTRFVERALETALAQHGRNVVVAAGVAADRAGRPEANYGALSRLVKPEAGAEVVEALDAAQERLGGGRFACGCATKATSPKAKCPKHGRSLAV